MQDDEAGLLLKQTDEAAKVLNQMRRLDMNNVDHIDDGADAVRKFLSFDVGKADDSRVAVVKAYEGSATPTGESVRWLSVRDIALFGGDVVHLSGQVQGLRRVLDGSIAKYSGADEISSGTFSFMQGSIHEIRVITQNVGADEAVWIGKKITSPSKNGDEVFEWGRSLSKLESSGEAVKLRSSIENVPISKLGLKEDEIARYGSTWAWAKHQLRNTDELEIDIVETQQKLIYHEAKSGAIDADDILHKYLRLKAYGLVTGKEVEMKIWHRTSSNEALASGSGSADEVLENVDEIKSGPGGNELQFPGRSMDSA